MSQLDPGAWNRWVSGLDETQLFDDTLPDQKIRAICENVGVPFVAGRDHLNYYDYIHEDGHWNKNGHKKIAKLLAKLYFQHYSHPTTAITSYPPEIRPVMLNGASEVKLDGQIDLPKLAGGAKIS
jgi:hypothetical protein